MHVSANDRIEPYTGVVTDLDVTDDFRPFGNEDPLSKLRQFPFVVQQHKSKRTTLTEAERRIQGTEFSGI